MQQSWQEESVAAFGQQAEQPDQNNSLTYSEQAEHLYNLLMIAS